MYTEPGEISLEKNLLEYETCAWRVDLSSYIDVEDDSSTAAITISLLDGYENAGDIEIYRYSRGRSVQNIYSKSNLQSDEIEFKLNREYMIDIVYKGAFTPTINSRLTIEWSVYLLEEEEAE